MKEKNRNQTYQGFEKDSKEYEYLKKYGLSKEGYDNVINIRKKIFNDKVFPEMIFNEGIKIYPTTGGSLLIEEDWNILQKLSKTTKDTHVFVVENKDNYAIKTDSSPIVLSYPIATKWEEIMDNETLENFSFKNQITMEFYYLSNVNAYIFGDSGTWGIFSLVEDPVYFEHPFFIIGCLPEYFDLFKSHFKKTEVNYENIENYLPLIYKKDM